MKKLTDDYFCKTESLTIRFYNIKDFSKWQRLFNDMNPKQNQWDWCKEEMESLTNERFNEKLVKHKQERDQGDIYYFCVEDRNKDLIGIALIKILTESNRKYSEIGFQLNNKFWNRGFGKELAKAMINICKNDIEISSVRALVNKKNFTSMHILESLGMQRKQENKNQWVFGL